MRARPTKILTQHIMNMCDPRPSLSARLTTHLTFRFVLVMRFWSTIDQTAMFMLVIVSDSLVCDTSGLILPVLLVLGLWKKVALNFSSVECFVDWWVMKIPLQRGPSLEWCNQSVEQQVFSTPNLIQFCLLLIFEFRAANYLKWYVSDTSLLIFRKKML